MAQPRGKTRGLTFTTQRIDKAVSGLNGGFFTSKEIYEITGLNRQIIRIMLAQKTEKGLLQRVRRGYYKAIPGISLAVKLPSAFIATKVWEILRQSDKPLIHREISEIITEDTGFNTYFEIGALLLIWCRRKVLDKIGGKRPYEYQIKPDYNLGRPSAGKLF